MNSLRWGSLMLFFSCAQHQQPCLFKGAHRMLWKPSGASGLAHFSKMPFCRLRTGIGVSLFPLCDFTVWLHLPVGLYCHLFLIVCKCWYCITCEVLRFFSSVKLCEERAFWEICLYFAFKSMYLWRIGAAQTNCFGIYFSVLLRQSLLCSGRTLGEWLFFIKCYLFLSAWLWLFLFPFKSKASFLTD